MGGRVINSPFARFVIRGARFCRMKVKAGLAKRVLAVLLLLAAVAAQAGSIEPKRAALTPGEDGYALSAEF